MIFTTLISTAELAQHLTDPDWAMIDCRFSLADPERGRRDYAQAHIAGAVYYHLGEDLAGPILPGLTGRHPLPAIDFAADKFSGWGIDDRVQVVVYDDAGGAYAARLWWMLRWLGHEAVAVLDGGWPKWKSEGRETRAGIAIRPSRRFIPHARPELLSTTGEIEASLRGAHPERNAVESKDATKRSSSPQEIASQKTLAMTSRFQIIRLAHGRTVSR